MPTLIGVYLLTGRPLEPLLEALDPQPAAANRERMIKLVEEKRGVRVKAGRGMTACDA